ncbi:hypothetical protein AnigIFM63309_003584 [Aspergillus niger]|nr:hypothetical protein AnigIFM63309_003584 [Aspergillus niger]
MITERLRRRPDGEDDNPDTVDLRVVVGHHQRGLQGFREYVAKISNSNAETDYAGSLILVRFIYASLQVPELTRYDGFPNICQAPAKLDAPHSRGVNCGPRSMAGLQASRMRPMVLHLHGDEYWKDLPFALSLSRLSHCSSRLLLFGEGASQAVADLRTSYAAIRLADDDKSCFTSISPSASSEGTVDEQSQTIDVLEMTYSRIISVLQCTVSERGCPDDSDIQADFEEAAVLSLPIVVLDDFISFLEVNDLVGLTYGLSLTILAHFYVVNTLVDRWFFGSFEDEIFKIHRSVCNLCNAQLDRLMLWPVKVAMVARCETNMEACG